MMNTYLAHLLIFLVSSISSCRNDTADQELSWSCADHRAKPYPTATPECLKQIEGERSEILKFYKAVPHMENGKLAYYSFIDRSVSPQKR